MSAADRLRSIIAERGPVRWDDVVSVALYDENHGFYRAGGHAGRRAGDFITSPEVGPLFGAVVANAIDAWWRAAGEPAEWRVAEVGAGRGTLARTIMAAEPACRSALTYSLVETSAALRSQHPAGEGLVSSAALPAAADVILANELLDNLPFRVARLAEGEWHEVVVATEPEGSLAEMPGPLIDLAALAPEAHEALTALGATAHNGTEVPIAETAASWVRAAQSVAGRVVVIDYGAPTIELAARPDRGWLRTYARQRRGTEPLVDLGSQDITIDVPTDQLPTPTRLTTQAEWLTEHGIAELVTAGEQLWVERASVGDLAAIRARSRSVEAPALVDPSGLGAFVVAEWFSPR